MKGLFASLILLLTTAAALAQETKPEDKPADPDTGESTIEERTLGLLPNPYQSKGIKFAVTTIDEVLANPVGGVKQATVYEGRLNVALDADLAKLMGWSGATFHANVFQIRGEGLSRNYIGNLMLASGIEAVPTTRLYEIWVEQKLMNEQLSVRIGQLAADNEFINASHADVFTNSSFGWPVILGVNLPAGGPSPPLAVPGARIKFKANDNWTFLAAVFDGNIAGPGSGDPQSRDLYGVNFRVTDPALLLGEIQYAYNQKSDDKLPGTIKVGAWRHAGEFQSQRFDTSGMSLASPASSGSPMPLHSDFGFYGVIDQTLYRFSKDREIGAFARVLANPGDRNMIDFYADAGVEFVAPFAKRTHDKFGVGIAYARLSSALRDLDRDYAALTPGPVRDSETLLTAAYEAEITKGWSLLPNVQFIRHPAGGATDPALPGGSRKIPDAVVVGLRSTAKF